MRREPSLTFRGALQILGKTETPLIDKLDVLLGGVILAAGAGAAVATVGGAAVAGAAFLAPAWQWVDQKNEAGGLLRKLVSRFGPRINGTSGLERRQAVAAAHSTIVVAAYFDVFHEAVEEAGFGGLTLTESEKAETAKGVGASLMEWLYSTEIPPPSASRGFVENVAEVERWLARLHTRNEVLLLALDLQRLFGYELKNLHSRAAERYRSYFIDLAANVREFEVWAALSEHATTRNAIDTSFARIEKLLTSINAETVPTLETAATIDRANRGRLNDRVVQAALPWPESTVHFPTIAELFVSPRFHIAPHNNEARASDERWWSKLPVHDDIAGRFAAHLLSHAATRAPMLLLGHPGAGKSMLTKVLAAHLPPADYTTVNVPLRVVNAHASILDQIQQALDRVTHKRVHWADVADETADRVRVVLLDGLDELLQASEQDRTGYLHDVVRFQEVEAEQGRPVAVVVTSRTVVADRVDIPEGTILVKLAEFDDCQIDEWLARWNKATSDDQGGRLSRNEALRHLPLARQPLLLMLLALYTSSPGATELLAELSTAALYDQLFKRFAGREAAKNVSDREFDDSAAVKASIDRLSIAALAMFNRGQQQIAEAHLGKDIEALTRRSTDSRPEVTGQRLLAEFFFVHAAEATVVDGRRTERCYEFLHATFGEYLVARKILEVLRDVAYRAFGGRRAREEPEDDLLQALLGHQILAGRKPVVQFVGEIYHALPEEERSHVLATVSFLVRRWRAQPRSDRYATYAPTTFDQIRHAAVYSANLVTLRLAFASEGCISLEDLLQDSSAAEWSSLVGLWRAGLDHNAWLAVLAAISLDECRNLRASPPAHRQYNRDYDFARLIGDHRTAEYLGVGAAVIGGERGVFDPDRSWFFHMVSELAQPIVLGELADLRLSRPPEGTTDIDVLTVIDMLERLLVSPVAHRSSKNIRRTVSLLLDLTSNPDPTALTLAICATPHLLGWEPRLLVPELYREAEVTVLMMHAAQPKFSYSDRPLWDALYTELCSRSAVRPEILSPPQLEVYRTFWRRIGLREGRHIARKLTRNARSGKEETADD